jgi:hypothetical protein
MPRSRVLRQRVFRYHARKHCCNWCWWHKRLDQEHDRKYEVQAADKEGQHSRDTSASGLLLTTSGALTVYSDNPWHDDETRSNAVVPFDGAVIFFSLRTQHPSLLLSRQPRMLARTLPAFLLLVLSNLLLPAQAIKFNLTPQKYPPSKCIWNSAHENQLVIVTANVGPGEHQRVDIEIVDSSEKKNVYLHKKNIKSETRLAVTTHAEGEIGVCFRNFLDSGEQSWSSAQFRRRSITSWDGRYFLGSREDYGKGSRS